MYKKNNNTQSTHTLTHSISNWNKNIYFLPSKKMIIKKKRKKKIILYIRASVWRIKFLNLKIGPSHIFCIAVDCF